MILYLDTSAFVKLLVDEPGRADLLPLAERAAQLASSRIAYPEARSALARSREGRLLAAKAYANARRHLERIWEGATIVEFHALRAQRAGELAERHLLRGMDAIHLASALDLSRESEESIIFASWDLHLRAAAHDERLETFPA